MLINLRSSISLEVYRLGPDLRLGPKGRERFRLVASEDLSL